MQIAQILEFLVVFIAVPVQRYVVTRIEFIDLSAIFLHDRFDSFLVAPKSFYL